MLSRSMLSECQQNANEQHAASTAIQIQSLRPACEVLPDASALFLCSSPFKPVKLCESSGKNRDQYKSKQSAGSFPKQSTQLHKGKLRLFSAIFFASSDTEVPLAFPKACDQTIQRVLCQFGSSKGQGSCSQRDKAEGIFCFFAFSKNTGTPHKLSKKTQNTQSQYDKANPVKLNICFLSLQFTANNPPPTIEKAKNLHGGHGILACPQRQSVFNEAFFSGKGFIWQVFDGGRDPMRLGNR